MAKRWVPCEPHAGRSRSRQHLLTNVTTTVLPIAVRSAIYCDLHGACGMRYVDWNSALAGQTDAACSSENEPASFRTGSAASRYLARNLDERLFFKGSVKSANRDLSHLIRIRVASVRRPLRRRACVVRLKPLGSYMAPRMTISVTQGSSSGSRYCARPIGHLRMQHS